MNINKYLASISFNFCLSKLLLCSDFHWMSELDSVQQPLLRTVLDTLVIISYLTTLNFHIVLLHSKFLLYSLNKFIWNMFIYFVRSLVPVFLKWNISLTQGMIEAWHILQGKMLDTDMIAMFKSHLDRYLNSKNEETQTLCKQVQLV